MAGKRSEQICLSATPWYHLCSRVVRRSFLCGKDKFTKKDFNHRRQWIEDRILALTDIFSIEIGAYAIMSNHYHIVAMVNKEKASDWTDQEVILRWHRIYKGTNLTKRYLNDENLNEVEFLIIEERATRNEIQEGLLLPDRSQSV